MQDIIAILIVVLAFVYIGYKAYQKIFTKKNNCNDGGDCCH